MSDADYKKFRDRMMEQGIEDIPTPMIIKMEGDAFYGIIPGFSKMEVIALDIIKRQIDMSIMSNNLIHKEMFESLVDGSIICAKVILHKFNEAKNKPTTEEKKNG